MDYENITLEDELELERRAKTLAEEAARRVLENSCSNGRAYRDTSRERHDGLRI